MKRLAWVAAISVLTAVAAAPGVGASPGGPSAKPLLRIVDTGPLTVRGVNFEPFERVTVVTITRAAAAKPVRYSRVARTGERGGFTLVLTGVEIGCSPFSITATSASGKRAVSAKIVPLCAIP